MPFPRCLALAATLTLALAAGACGGGSTGGAPPTASAPDATAPPPDATQPGTTAVAPTATAPTTPAQTAPPGGGRNGEMSGEGGNGGSPGGTAGGGGEEAVRVPAAFTITAHGRLKPRTITVPAFLAVEISLRSKDRRAHTLALRGPVPHALRVPAGKRVAMRVPGLRAGRYAVLIDGRRAGALVAGGEPGP
ncbi:MAG: hypothetical protein JSS99_00510 [Actinobacteria bacterium]|nr:hypothetical protein [Actinomycetota bacterium]